MDIHWKQEYTGDMEVRKRDGVTYLSYPRLERESAIVHGFSTRLGGVSGVLCRVPSFSYVLLRLNHCHVSKYAAPDAMDIGTLIKSLYFPVYTPHHTSISF